MLTTNLFMNVRWELDWKDDYFNILPDTVTEVTLAPRRLNSTCLGSLPKSLKSLVLTEESQYEAFLQCIQSPPFSMLENLVIVLPQSFANPLILPNPITELEIRGGITLPSLESTQWPISLNSIKFEQHQLQPIAYSHLSNHLKILMLGDSGPVLENDDMIYPPRSLTSLNLKRAQFNKPASPTCLLSLLIL